MDNNTITTNAHSGDSVHFVAIYISCITLEVIIILCHCLGLYLLTCLIHNGNGTAQTVYIMSLSASEILGSILYMIGYALFLTQIKSKTFYLLFKYIGIVVDSVVMFLYYTSIMYIVGDKVLEVALNIRYSLYFSVRKATCIVATTWAVGVLLCVGVILLDYLLGKNVYVLHGSIKTVITYFYVTFDFLFITVAISSYSYIFFIYLQTRTQPVHPSHATNMQHTQQTHSTSTVKRVKRVFSVFRNSRFYISLLLILNFLLLTVTPDLLFFFIIKKMDPSGHDYEIAMATIYILYEVSFLIDGWIYVFIESKVRRLLWRKLARVTCLQKILPVSDAAGRHAFLDDIHASDRSTAQTPVSTVSTHM